MLRRFAFLVAILLPTQLAQAEQPSSEDFKFFESKIRPVLIQRCYKCHSAETLKKKKKPETSA